MGVGVGEGADRLCVSFQTKGKDSFSSYLKCIHRCYGGYKLGQILTLVSEEFTSGLLLGMQNKSKVIESQKERCSFGM